MKTYELELEGRRFTVGLVHTHFPKGGGWSFWVCPSCGRFARTMRLLGERLVCARCDGLLRRCQMGTTPATRHRGEKTNAIARLAELVNRPRLKNRRRLEASLERKLIAEREARLKGWKG